MSRRAAGRATDGKFPLSARNLRALARLIACVALARTLAEAPDRSKRLRGGLNAYSRVRLSQVPRFLERMAQQGGGGSRKGGGRGKGGKMQRDYRRDGGGGFGGGGKGGGGKGGGGGDGGWRSGGGGGYGGGGGGGRSAWD